MTLPTLDVLDVRVPAWNRDAFSTRLCPICGDENDALIERPDRLAVAFCNTCGCWYVHDLPSHSDILRLYEGYFYDHRPVDLSGQNVSELIANARNVCERNWKLVALSRLFSGRHRMRVLDVGCGTGQFLLEARSFGFDVVGCDLSPEAANFANNCLGLEVHQSELHACEDAIGRVDAVVMNDFIEHPSNPIKVIESALRLLNPDGLLLITTPNGGEAGQNIETALNWVGFRVDLEHLQYLSPRTIGWLCREHSLQIERLEASGLPLLDGLTSHPKAIRYSRYSPKMIAKKVPGVVQSVRALRRLNIGRHRSDVDIRLGSYHLNVILRKSSALVKGR